MFLAVAATVAASQSQQHHGHRSGPLDFADSLSSMMLLTLKHLALSKSSCIPKFNARVTEKLYQSGDALAASRL